MLSLDHSHERWKCSKRRDFEGYSDQRCRANEHWKTLMNRQDQELEKVIAQIRRVQSSVKKSQIQCKITKKYFLKKYYI